MSDCADIAAAFATSFLAADELAHLACPSSCSPPGGFVREKLDMLHQAKDPLKASLGEDAPNYKAALDNIEQGVDIPENAEILQSLLLRHALVGLIDCVSRRGS